MTDRQPGTPGYRSSARHPGGVEHVDGPHHGGFTVVGHDLAQHPELSLTAIGLAAHIRSLPPGTPIEAGALAERFPEGEAEIAAALRELEEHGYLAPGSVFHRTEP